MAGTHSRRSFFPLALVLGYPHSSQLSRVSPSSLKSQACLLSPGNRSKKPCVCVWGGRVVILGEATCPER